MFIYFIWNRICLCNVAQEHLTSFYKTFRDIENEKFDGLIITGAPVETLSFEEVDYWEELKRIMEYSKRM